MPHDTPKVPGLIFAIGAYGRTANRKDWEEGKDFAIWGQGPYFSKRDLPVMKADGVKRIIFVTQGKGIAFTLEIE